jgi:hypothetical protein
MKNMSNKCQQYQMHETSYISMFIDEIDVENMKSGNERDEKR